MPYFQVIILSLIVSLAGCVKLPTVSAPTITLNPLNYFGSDKRVAILPSFSDSGRLEFHLEKKGWLFKSKRPVKHLETATIENLAEPVWAFSLLPEDNVGYNRVLTPNTIRYGQTPEGYHELVAPQRLQFGEEYQITMSGPDYATTQRFVLQ